MSESESKVPAGSGARARRGSRGRFIVLEGIDGSGTTTQARRLVEALEARGEPTLLTCEPTSGPVGALLRQALQKKLLADDGAAARRLDWTTLALLFAADRLDHLHQVVVPALEAGRTVVSDRYVLSSLAYQSVTSPEGPESLPWIRELNRHAPPPDLTLVLDVDEAVAAERRALRGGPPELFEVREIQRKLADFYARAGEVVPTWPLVHVPDGTPDQVFERLLRAAVGRG